MLLTIHHIGVTVGQLDDARLQLESVLPCTHTQSDISVPPCLKLVSLRPQREFDIALHGKLGGMDVELIAYRRLSRRTNPALIPWNFVPEHSSDAIRCELRRQDQNGDASSFAQLASRLQALPALNAVIIPARDVAREAMFWKRLGLIVVLSEPEVVVLFLAARIPPFEARYIVVAYTEESTTSASFTDFAGVNEVALLCTSAANSAELAGGDSFRTPVSRLIVAERALDITFVRSPSGALVEFFSVARV